MGKAANKASLPQEKREANKSASGSKPVRRKQSVKPALDGLRVIELGAFQVAPLAAKWLAEAGAEVIKVEGLPGGDPIRGATVAVLRGRPADIPNWFHEYLNRNKKSVALNLEHEGSREIIYGLVKKSDVFISNLRTATLEKWGLDYDSLMAVNPKLIYAQGTGFGMAGPDATRPGLDLIGQARSGMLSVAGDLEAFSMMGGLTPCDRVAGLLLAHGITTALLARERNGLGQRVDTSLLAAGMYLLAHELQYYTGTGEVTAVVNRKGVRNPLRNLYQTRDGRWIVLNMTQGDRYWPEFCKALSIEHLQHDPRFESLASRAEHRAELIPVVEQVFGSKTKDEWEQILSRHNLIWSVVNTIPEVAADAQVLENGYLVDSTHQKAGTIKVIGPLIGLNQTPLNIGEPAPELGQHTEEVLLGVGGYGWEDLAQFKDAGIIL